MASTARICDKKAFPNPSPTQIIKTNQLKHTFGGILDETSNVGHVQDGWGIICGFQMVHQPFISFVWDSHVTGRRIDGAKWEILCRNRWIGENVEKGGLWRWWKRSQTVNLPFQRLADQQFQCSNWFRLFQRLCSCFQTFFTWVSSCFVNWIITLLCDTQQDINGKNYGFSGVLRISQLSVVWQQSKGSLYVGMGKHHLVTSQAKVFATKQRWKDFIVQWLWNSNLLFNLLHRI